MPHYLVIAHQTADSSELVSKVRELAATQPDAAFTMLVPTTPVQHLLTWWEGEKRVVALSQAERAAAALRKVGARVEEYLVGDASPVNAIYDELRRRPGYYDALVICTFPRSFSRWLQLDLLSRAQRTGLPVIHVEAPSDAMARRSA